MISAPNSVDEDLLTALKKGSEEAFTAIYKKYWYKMFLVAYRKLQNKEIAEELIQEIFTRLWKEKESIRIVSLNYYLFSAVRYEVIDTIRVQGSHDEYLKYYYAFTRYEECNTEHTVVYNDLVRSIDGGLDILPQKSKQIFKLHRIEYWPVSKIAAHLELSEKAVEYHITKATKLLRSYLKETFIFFSVLLIPFLLLY